MPFVQKMQTLIEEDAIGKVQLVKAEFAFPAPVIPEGRLYNKQLGGGSVLDLGVYPIFLATFLLGKPIKINAATQQTHTGVDASASILLQYANGATAQLFSSIIVQSANEAEIIGTKGRIKVSSMWHAATQLTLLGNDGTQQVFNFPHPCNGFEYEIEEVHRCLNNHLLQSEKMPHELSLQIAEIMDAVLAN